jgi:hypothetical protein
MNSTVTTAMREPADWLVAAANATAATLKTFKAVLTHNTTQDLLRVKL